MSRPSESECHAFFLICCVVVILYKKVVHIPPIEHIKFKRTLDIGPSHTCQKTSIGRRFVINNEVRLMGHVKSRKKVS